MFLVRTDFHRPVDVPDDHLSALVIAERVRAEELQRNHTIRLLWREPSTSVAWGIWEAPGESELYEAIRSLPLSCWMDIAVHPVIDHPNAVVPPSQTWSTP